MFTERSFALAAALGLVLALNATARDVPDQPQPTPALVAAAGTNRFYLSNRAPLAPSRLLELPIGAVRAKGWLWVYLDRQHQGLTGKLGEISGWLQKENNAWLSLEGKGDFGWEEVPYWLRGYIQLAYLLEDRAMIAESQLWIEAALRSQRADGDFGPPQRFANGARDYWANMVMLYALQTYYERSHDPRVIELMTRYFKHQLAVPDDRFLVDYWQHIRGGDNLYIVHWLYNLTGDPDLLKLGDKLHRRTINWCQKDTLPDWHNVNIAQGFREPATYFRQTGERAQLQATYDVYHTIRRLYGQVPGGMFGGDEVSRPGYTDPRQAVETCGAVEQMLSDELLLSFTGDAAWGDQCEDVAFNTYPAMVMPDFRALRYLTAPNLVVSDSRNHAPGLFNAGPFLMMNPFSSRCCQHNHSQGWPAFARHLWMATPDHGLCAALYSASEVTARVGDGATVRITEDTHYPFEPDLRFMVKLEQPARFPLYFRIPAWCRRPQLRVNGKPTEAALTPGQFTRLERSWENGDRIVLELPMELSVRTWTENHRSVSVDYGPLTFSLRIAERLERRDSAKTAIGDSRWQKGADPSLWPSFEIHPASPWNYALDLDPEHPEKSFRIRHRRWPKSDFPFTLEESPIWLVAKARQVPEWTLDRYGLCAPLQDSPVSSTEPLQTVSLVPMGAARLRVSAFPTLGDGAAHRWSAPALPRPPAFPTSASHTFQGDTTDALSDGLLPSHSNDHSLPRFTWWPRKGGTEWVQYDFPQARAVSEVAVYWFDDTGAGACRVPQSWRLLYRQGDAWVPVAGASAYGVERDRLNPVRFLPVTTTALRLEATLQADVSGGILEWQVK